MFVKWIGKFSCSTFRDLWIFPSSSLVDDLVDGLSDGKHFGILNRCISDAT